MNKKLIALLLGLGIATTSIIGFAGCGDSNSNNGNTGKDEVSDGFAFKSVSAKETATSTTARTANAYGMKTFAGTNSSLQRYRNAKFYAHIELDNPNHYVIQKVSLKYGGKTMHYAAFNFNENSDWEDIYLEVPAQLENDVGKYQVTGITYINENGQKKTAKITGNDNFVIEVKDIRPAEIINAPTFTESADGSSYIMTNYDKQFLLANGNYTIPSSYRGKPITGVGEYAFAYQEGIKSLVIPDSIVEIEDGAFYDCLNMEKVEFGNGVEHVGFQAFHGCDNVNYVDYTGTLNSWFKIMFGYSKQEQIERMNSEDPAIMDYNDTKNDYRIRNANPMEFANDLHINGKAVTQITVEDLAGIDHISDAAFSSSLALKSIDLGNDVKTVGFDAFHSVPGVTDLNLGNVEILGNQDFCSAYGVTELVLPASLRKFMGASKPIRAMERCFKITNNSQLSDDVIFNTLSDIDAQIFTVNGINKQNRVAVDNTYNTDNDGFVWLTNSAITDKIYLVGYEGTAKEITIPVEHDGKNVVLVNTAFASNSVIEKVTIPEGFTQIPMRFFAFCPNLKEVTVKGDIEKVSDKAFLGTVGTKIIFEKNCHRIDKTAFRLSKNLEVTVSNADVVFANNALERMTNATINYAGTISQYKALTESGMGTTRVYNSSTIIVNCSDGLYDPAAALKE